MPGARSRRDAAGATVSHAGAPGRPLRAPHAPGPPALPDVRGAAMNQDLARLLLYRNARLSALRDRGVPLSADSGWEPVEVKFVAILKACCRLCPPCPAYYNFYPALHEKDVIRAERHASSHCPHLAPVGNPDDPALVGEIALALLGEVLR